MKNYLITAFLLFVLVACIKKYEHPKWEVEALAPVIKTSLNVADIISDTNVKSGINDSLSIIYREPLSTVSIDTLIQMDVKPFIRNVKLDSIHLPAQSIEYTITMGEVITENGLSGYLPDGSVVSPLYSSFLNNIQIPLAPDTIDASEYFKMIELENGMLYVNVENGFPIVIDSVNYVISNVESGDIIDNGKFPTIPSNSVVQDSTDLSGKAIEGKLLVEFGVVTIPEVPAGTVINYSDNLTTEVNIKDMKIHAAEAKFPAQTILQHQNNVVLEDMEDVELTFARIREGKLKINVVSTIDQETYFTYSIPKLRDEMDKSFIKNMTVPASTYNNSIDTTYEFSFVDYKFDLTGKNNDTVNTFYNELIGNIDSIGEHVYLSLEDSVKVVVEIVDIKPYYAQGYLGQKDFSLGPDTTSFDVFDKFKIDSLSLAGAKIGLTVENGIGMEGNLQFNNVSAINSRTNRQTNLDISSLPSDILIAGAIEVAYDNIETKTTTFQLNDNNSNISDLVSTLPDLFVYHINVATNPSGNTGAYDNFAYSTNSLNTFIDAEIPLNISAKNLMLSDTADFKTGNIDNVNRIKHGKLKFIVNNGFPFDAFLNLYFLNKDLVVFDTLVSSQNIAPAYVDNSLVVNKSRESVVSFYFGEGELEPILEAHKVVVEAIFTTFPENKHIQLFSTYSMDIKAVGDFVYELDNKLN